MRRLCQIVLLIILPTSLVVFGCYCFTMRHSHAQVVQFAGYSINHYLDANGDKFYELTSSRNLLGAKCESTSQRVVLNKVYAFIIRNNTLYVRANGGDAAISANGFCRLFPSSKAPHAVGDDIYILPSFEDFFPKDYQTLSLMTHHYNSYSTRGRDVVASFGNGRFRIESVLDQNGNQIQALIDAHQLEQKSGNTIRLLSQVLSYEIAGDTFVVFAKEGQAVFHNLGNKYAVMYYNNGVYKRLRCAPDIKPLLHERQFTIADRALLGSVSQRAVS